MSSQSIPNGTLALQDAKSSQPPTTSLEMSRALLGQVLLCLRLGIIEVDANKTLKAQASILSESAQAHAVRLAP